MTNILNKSRNAMYHLPNNELKNLTSRNNQWTNLHATENPILLYELWMWIFVCLNVSISIFVTPMIFLYFLLYFAKMAESNICPIRNFTKNV